MLISLVGSIAYIKIIKEDLCTVGERGRKEEESIIYPRWKTVGDLSTVSDWGRRPPARPKANQADNDMGRYKRVDGRAGDFTFLHFSINASGGGQKSGQIRSRRKGRNNARSSFSLFFHVVHLLPLWASEGPNACAVLSWIRIFWHYKDRLG